MPASPLKDNLLGLHSEQFFLSSLHPLQAVLIFMKMVETITLGRSGGQGNIYQAAQTIFKQTSIMVIISVCIIGPLVEPECVLMMLENKMDPWCFRKSK